MRPAGEVQDRVLPADPNSVAMVITEVITNVTLVTSVGEIESWQQRWVRASGGIS
jgi:hypothetical protein